MAKSNEGSTRRLLELCGCYFLFYVIYSIATKYLTGPAEHGLPGADQLEYLVFSTLGGSLICLLVILFFRWGKMESARYIQWGKFRFPSEFLYIVPSGICTAIIIPTTTLLYTLLRSVMVAMLIMRGSVIVISRLVDAIQIKAGIFRKKVYKQEDLAVVFAIMAVCVQLFFVRNEGGNDLFQNPAAMLVLGSYLLGYFIRIYIMNYYKNTRGAGVKQDNKAFFAVEQVSASMTILLVLLVIMLLPALKGGLLHHLQQCYLDPGRHWPGEILAGTAYGIVAFFSVFIFMFKGRTATFAGLSNRLTSLVAGTTATLLFAVFFQGNYPMLEDWLSLVFIFIAVAFMSRAETKRAAELKKESAAYREAGPSNGGPENR
jgi:membrane-associated phospholipid phosphatase